MPVETIEYSAEFSSVSRICERINEIGSRFSSVPRTGCRTLIAVQSSFSPRSHSAASPEFGSNLRGEIQRRGKALKQELDAAPTRRDERGALMSNASALLSALNSRPSSAAAAQQQQQQQQPPPSSDPLSPHINHAADPWSSSSSGHLPLSISHSINNPGLPSGVIVSSAAVNAMDRADGGGGGGGGGGHGRGASSGGGGALSRSETPGLPNGLVGLGGGGAGGAPSGGGGGGKLLLQGGLPLAATSSLIQPGSVPGGGANSMGAAQSENEKVYYLIVDLMNPDTREAALLELSKKREQWDDLALVLWHSFGAYPSPFARELVRRADPPAPGIKASCRRCCKRSCRCTRSSLRLR